jgi:hypothetical protein
MLSRSATTSISCRSLLNPQSLEEKNKLEFEEDHRVDTGAAGGSVASSVAILDQIPHKREIKGLFQVAISSRWR